MAVKYYCDACGVEITGNTDVDKKRGQDRRAPGRLSGTMHRNGRQFTFEVITGSNGTANDVLLCRYCVLDMVAMEDDRPRGE